MTSGSPSLVKRPAPTWSRSRRGRVASVLALVVVAVVAVVLLTRGAGPGSPPAVPSGLPVTDRAFTGLDEIRVADVGGRPVLVDAGDDGTVALVDTATGERIGVPVAGGAVAAATATAREGRTVVLTGGPDRAVRLHDVTTGETRPEPLFVGSAPVVDLAVTDLDGRAVVVLASEEGGLSFVDLVTGVPVRPRILAEPGSLGRLETPLIVAERRVVSTGPDGAVRVWNPDSGNEIGTPFSGVPGSGAEAGTLGGDGVVAVDGPAGWQLRHYLTGEVLAAGDGAPATVATVAGRTLVAVGSGSDVVLRDALTGRTVGPPLTGHTGPVTDLRTVEAQGRVLLVSAGGDALRVWDLSGRAA